MAIPYTEAELKSLFRDASEKGYGDCKLVHDKSVDYLTFSASKGGVCHAVAIRNPMNLREFVSGLDEWFAAHKA